MNAVEDWAEIPITFRARCYDCGKEILPGRAFWSESKKLAKHLRCGARKSQIDDKNPAVSLDSKPTNTKVMGNFSTSLEYIELKCFICGKRAGCSTCSYSISCNRKIVSQLCICKTCLNPKDEKKMLLRIIRKHLFERHLPMRKKTTKQGTNLNYKPFLKS